MRASCAQVSVLEVCSANAGIYCGPTNAVRMRSPLQVPPNPRLPYSLRRPLVHGKKKTVNGTLTIRRPKANMPDKVKVTKTESFVVIFVPMDEPSANTDLARPATKARFSAWANLTRKYFRSQLMPYRTIPFTNALAALSAKIEQLGIHLVRQLTCGRVHCRCKSRQGAVFPS